MTTHHIELKALLDMARACRFDHVQPVAMPLESAIKLISEAYTQGRYAQLKEDCERLDLKLKHWRKHANTFAIND